MNIPEKAYEPLLDGNTISFFPKAKCESEHDLVHIKFPTWLVKLLDEQLEKAREEGRKEIRDGLNKLITGR